MELHNFREVGIAARLRNRPKIRLAIHAIQKRIYPYDLERSRRRKVVPWGVSGRQRQVTGHGDRSIEAAQTNVKKNIKERIERSVRQIRRPFSSKVYGHPTGDAGPPRAL